MTSVDDASFQLHLISVKSVERIGRIVTNRRLVIGEIHAKEENERTQSRSKNCPVYGQTIWPHLNRLTGCLMGDRLFLQFDASIVRAGDAIDDGRRELRFL